MKKSSMVGMLVVAVAMSAGCMTARFTVSKPVVKCGGGVKKMGGNTLTVSDVRITVRPYNFVNDASFLVMGIKYPKRFQEKTERAFYLEIALNAQQEGYQFDPEEVELSIAGETHKPIAVLGPAREREVYLTGLFGFKEFKNFFLQSDNEGSLSEASTLSLSAKSPVGVLLKFELYTPAPEEDYSIVINGLTQDGFAVDVPEISFRKGYAVIVDDL